MRLSCAMALFALFAAEIVLQAADAPARTWSVGLAEVDITPKYPIRLNGFGFRRRESEGVTQKIHAKALAIDDGGKDPALLITVDILGIPADITRELARRFEKKAGLKPERLALTATHTHTAPMLRGVNPTLFGVPIPRDHLATIDRYTTEFLDKVEEVGLAALKQRQPAQLTWGIGQVGFARNRRNPPGPVDHDLPVLVVRDPKGKIRAVYVSYACHCVTLSNNKISGDWAGYAQEAIQDAFPGAVAFVSIGCGADANPSSGVTGDNTEIASRQGLEIAREVQRLVKGYLAPVHGPLQTAGKTITLDLAPLPERAGWETLAKRQDAIGHHARVQLEKLARKEKLRTALDYPIMTWTFGDALAMVFLPGEVVADYGLRLKRELDGRRLWINAYANEAPCYIPSERVLKEGGYEGGGAMIYYDVPVPFKPGLEERIVGVVKEQLGKRFSAPHDPRKIQGKEPLSPQQSLAALQPRPGMSVDLVAAEPLVIDPVAIDFGPDGKLWVAEMNDYPTGKTGKWEPAGRVRVLIDSDGDGIFDRATVFLDGIPFPTGIKVWRKGVLVCAAPDILYAEDTDGDGKADVVRKLYSGFGTSNYQARVNSLEWSLDGWIYGSCGLFGGTIQRVGQDTPLSLGDRDFRLQPDRGAIEPATGRTQQGRVRDDWDNWFGCDNSTLVRHYVLPDHYLARNPHLLPPVSAVYVPDYPNSNRLYPATTEQQRFKLSGPANLVTSACGLGIYRDDLLGDDFTGNALVCEPVNLLVHRLRLSSRGSTFSGRRAAEETTNEFLASRDGWFRPVQVKTGPDGALWVVDMYRFVIEHPRWIPPEQLATVDVRAGHTMGRIYRVRPKDRALRTWPRLDRLDTAGLVAALDSPNGWQRDMVSQMLLWEARHDAAPALGKLARASKRPQTRVHALCVLAGLGKLQAESVQQALADPHPGVRRHAVRLAEPFLATQSKRLASALLHLTTDADAQVRLQLAFTLGAWRDPQAASALAQLALQHADDPYLVAAVLSSVDGDKLPLVLREVFARAEGKAPPAELAQPLGRLAVLMNKGAALPSLVAIIVRPEQERWSPWQMLALASLLDTLERRGEELKQREEIVKSAESMISSARLLVSSDRTPEKERLAALSLLGRQPAKHQTDAELLAALLQPRTPATLQGAALSALARMPGDKPATLLLARWRSLSPTAKAQVLDALLSRPAWQIALVQALEKNELPAAQIDLPRRQRLLHSRVEAVRTRAAKLFASGPSADRQKVLRDYQQVATLKGDLSRGKQAFARVCATCHQFQGVGHVVGPDLHAVALKTPQYFLTEILDPNRNVDARYVEYQATTRAGRTFTGLMVSESAGSITLRGQEGKEQTIARSEIEELISSGKSLMPEGMEKVLPPQELADLIAYLSSVPIPAKVVPGNRPTVLRVEKGRVTLHASSCEIRGGQITFEGEFKNIGMWHGGNDHILWRIELDQEKTFDVWLDYACDRGSAGNRFLLEGGTPVLGGEVASTGGWDRYRQVKLGTIKLAAGKQTVRVRPEGERLRGALLDLRTLYLVPVGEKVPLP